MRRLVPAHVHAPAHRLGHHHVLAGLRQRGLPRFFSFTHLVNVLDHRKPAPVLKIPACAQTQLPFLGSLAAGWLPAVLAEFRATYPGIELEVADVLSESCIEQVRAGKADFAIAAIRADTPELRAEQFCTDQFHLVCPAKHVLASSAQLRPRDLAPFPFIHLSRTSSVRQYLDAAVHPLQMNTLLEVDQLATVMGMVRAGLGISVVPSLTLFHFQHAGIVTRPLGWAGLTRRIYLVRRRDRSLSLAAESLHALVLRHKPPLDPVAQGRRTSGATIARMQTVRVKSKRQGLPAA
ncbi:MAG: LysR family transcriptional regulator [Chitinophagaceae bacterium]|nr:LysR family transcriptional regulator [Rubrivivax sp.]